jgi:hypothetical protein
VEIIPQADHLRRIAGRPNLNFGELQLLPAGLCTSEQIAGMNRDRIAFQRAETGLSTLLKTDPFCHLRSPGTGSVIELRGPFVIVAVMSGPAILHCIIGCAADA